MLYIYVPHQGPAAHHICPVLRNAFISIQWLIVLGVASANSPHVLVSFEILEAADEGINALLVVPPCKFANETKFLVLFEPIGGSNESFLEDGRADTSSRSARTIRIQVLMHLEDELVLRVLKLQKRSTVTAGNPCPST